jgi:DNA mismatch repair protein MutS
MLELKAILSQSTADSLILADELSHGTETNSGVAILSTSIDFLTRVGAKFIFTTHLHQVTNVSIIKNNKLVNLEHLSVDFNDNDKCFIYNRKLEPGSGDSVYGLIVAKGLGLDKEFIRSANSILLEITSNKDNIQHLLDFNQTKYNANKLKANCELCGENAIDTHHIEHQSKANPRNFTENGHLNRKSNLLSVCKGCHSDIHNGTIKNIRYIFTTYGIMLQYSKEDNK